MLRGGSSVLGIINFITFLISIPILGGGIWLASRANSTDCIRFLQWPIIIVGLVLMVISLMGFAGACYRQTWLLRLYLFAMFFVVLALLFFIVFAFAVTDRGDGQVVMNRRFPEYQLSDYGGWLRDRVADPQYWTTISACLRDGHACAGMRRLARDPNTGMLVPETPTMFYGRNLSPIQSGCCKPPTSCAFSYMNETYWTQNPSVPTVTNDPDCKRWSNDQQTLCFQCDSCKAGVLAGIKNSWRKVAVLNIVVLIILVIVYVAGCAAFRNAKRIDNGEAIGMARMTKSHPSRFQF
uniref:Senescence-associated protein n=1 Tax=Zea mays TaxID=4577 RepID=B6TBV1_MAIZE|nr:senescence-associated protein [Zea mays]